MSVSLLEKYLPENSLSYLKKWFGNYFIHIKITKGRNSKLGDYRKRQDGSHEITINSTLEPQLFFFVLTHELAHLLAFEIFGNRILSHGKEWKHTFREMLLESIEVYSDDLKPIIVRFSKSPKANFMASTELVRFFYTNEKSNLQFVETLQQGDFFIYRKDKYLLEGLIKKNYLCKNVSSGRKYVFKPLAQVEKCS